MRRTRLGLGWTDELGTVPAELPLLLDSDERGVEVDVGSPHPEHLTLAETDERGEEHDRPGPWADEVGQLERLGDGGDRSF